MLPIGMRYAPIGAKDVSCETNIKIILALSSSAMKHLYTIWNRNILTLSILYTAHLYYRY